MLIPISVYGCVFHPFGGSMRCAIYALRGFCKCKKVTYGCK
jgi:hypothetical protein